MILWGAIWGALIGLLGSRFDGEQIVVGALLGALAGWTLQRLVDRRVAALSKQSVASGAAPPSPAAAPAPVSAAPTLAPQAAPSRVVPEEPLAGVVGPAPSLSAAAAQDAAPASSQAIDAAVARFKAWLFGGNTVARLGAVVLFIGLAFLARFAAERGLVPPQLRLAGIGVVAIGLLVAGFRLRHRSLGYALTLQGAGVAILYLTLFAAFRLYGFLPPLLALGLMVAVCALSAAIAVLQDARALAVIGAAGGFLAPILASTGQGDHVALFSYYTILNLGILGVAWKKDWRLLNVVGFVFTFGIAAFWGALRYDPTLYATTQPFLVMFFAMYVALAVVFALRRAPKLTDYVDGTLVFGVPLVGFGLQAALVHSFEFGLAWSALALAAVYLALAALLARRRMHELRLLVESFLALGVIFLSLAVPLALDARWTAAAWALEGAALVWIGLRQNRRLPRAAGLLLQAGAGFAFIRHLDDRIAQTWPLLNADFVGAVLLAGSAILSSWWLSRRSTQDSNASGYTRVERGLEAPLFLYGFAWWIGALTLEITRRGGGDTTYAISPADNWLFLFMLAFVASAALACWRGVKLDWRIATWPAYASLPLMLVVALIGSLAFRHVFQYLGWLCWPLAIAAHLIALRWIDTRTPARWFTALHAGGVYLLVLLTASVANALIDAAELWRSGWGPAALVAGLTLLIFAIAKASTAERWQGRWPMARNARAYGWLGLGPVAAVTIGGALLMVVTQRGNAAPLPHVPLLNPIDLAFLLALSTLWFWREQCVAAAWSLSAPMRDRRFALATAGGALFVWINTVWLRAVHHYAGVPWNARSLFDSFLVQAGYALLWTAIAVTLMVVASRRKVRAPWLVGAALLGATVLKLFVVDLPNAGGTERIVAFVGVGALMLLVGYLAPLPPTAAPSNRAEAA